MAAKKIGGGGRLLTAVQVGEGRVYNPGDEAEFAEAELESEQLQRLADNGAIEGFGTSAQEDKDRPEATGTRNYEAKMAGESPAAERFAEQEKKREEYERVTGAESESRKRGGRKAPE